jgi:PEP-CTERM motif
MNKLLFTCALVATTAICGVARAAAILDNGTVRIGVNDLGNLITDDIGITYLPTNREALAPGCDCEGWGLGRISTNVGGGASASSVNGGIANVNLLSFASTATTARSVASVNVGAGQLVQVTHDFGLSASANLFQVNVTLKNTSGSTINAGDLFYRRAMDWDVPPTTFAEFVTIQGVPSALGIANGTNLWRTSDNGFSGVTGSGLFSPPNDLGRCGVNTNFVDCGPADHGAVFDFQFAELLNNDEFTFSIFYGAAANEAEALGALAAVGGGLFSFGQPGGAVGGGVDNNTTTFIFGFRAAGGVFTPPTPNPVPEPASLSLLGLGLLGFCFARRRKAIS